ncbi:MAG: hypothetical protein N3E44_03955, partial [Candidatus Bathyarchaeota archaeon]|nr:hypothetical protein [Candidatus Bathyarchaeota archaeon]
MDRKIYSKLSVALLTLLMLSILPNLAVKLVAAESMMTDRPLYAIKWKDNALGYVNVTVILKGLYPETRYEIAVFKHHGPVGLNYVREIYGVYEANITFTIPPTMDSRPEDIAGTWNATLYKVVGETRSIVTWSNFGIWAINSRVLNYGRILQIWGGGFKPGTKVEFTVYNKTDGKKVTSILFGEDPAKSPVSGVVCMKYGTFSNASDTITTIISEGTYVVNLTKFEYLPKVASLGAPERTLEFNVTRELIVNILKPADDSEWRRT